MNEEEIKILFVEDTDLDYELFSHMISRTVERPHTIQNVQDKRSMIAFLERDEKFDLILLDLGLPDSVEYDSIDAIKRLNKDVPIIVLSGADTDVNSEDAKKMGVEEFIVKSLVEKETLSKAILRAIS